MPFITYKNNEEENITWKNPLETFFLVRNLTSSLNANQVNEFQSEIYKEIRIGIINYRSALNLQTKFRPNTDKMITDMGDYLRDIENFTAERISDDVFEEKTIKWKYKIIKKIPKTFTFKALPLFFSEKSPEKIKNFVIDNCENFLNVNFLFIYCFFLLLFQMKK